MGSGGYKSTSTSRAFILCWRQQQCPAASASCGRQPAELGGYVRVRWLVIILQFQEHVLGLVPVVTMSCQGLVRQELACLQISSEMRAACVQTLCFDDALSNLYILLVRQLHCIQWAFTLISLGSLVCQSRTCVTNLIEWATLQTSCLLEGPAS